MKAIFLFSGEDIWANICTASIQEYFLQVDFYHLCAIPYAVLHGYNAHTEYQKYTQMY